MDPGLIAVLGIVAVVLAAIVVSFNAGVRYGRACAENEYLEAQLGAARESARAAREMGEDYARGVSAIPDANGLRVLWPDEDEARADFTATPEAPGRNEAVGPPTDASEGSRRSQRLLPLPADA